MAVTRERMSHQPDLKKVLDWKLRHHEYVSNFFAYWHNTDGQIGDPKKSNGLITAEEPICGTSM